jgi:hypothetical protein
MAQIGEISPFLLKKAIIKNLREKLHEKILDKSM